MAQGLRMRVLLIVCWLTLLTGSARAGCLILCGDSGVEPGVAAQMLADELQAPLPPSVTVEAMWEGGFQDQFIQVRLSATEAGTAALLAQMGLDMSALKQVSADSLGPPHDDGWGPQTEIVLLGGEGTLGHFAFTQVAISPFPGTLDQTTIYIFAFET